ncbi:MAG: DUF2155 domain-containing protein [Alphaproteobacteria bacterium PRO2]|nr:DUF2155 domain-containing protein [Alphaproteobacteria bacterium PRO2]
MENYPVVKLQSLDKVTARTMTFEAKVGNTVKFGSLFIKIQACAKAPPIEQPESAAFLQIWEMKSKGESDSVSVKDQPPKEEAQWIFSGWMFASSPALSHMDHPIYDVWVLDCLNARGEKAGVKKEEKKEEPKAGEEAAPPAAEGETSTGETSAADAPAAETPGAEGAVENPADTPVESEELSPLGD